MLEDKIREDFINILCKTYNYPRSNIKKEVSIKMGSSTKRADIGVYSDKGDLLGLIETKSKGIKEGKKQLESYMSATHCEWGICTNGTEEEHCYKDNNNGKIIFDPTFTIPSHNQSIAFAKKFKIKRFEDLKNPVNLKYVFVKIKTTIYANTNIGRSHKQGSELIKLLFCKIYDEKEAKESQSYLIRFQVGFEEEKDEVAKRIKGIWKKFRENRWFGNDIFESNEEIVLDSYSLVVIVKQLQHFSLLKADKDVIGEAFEIFAEKGFAGEKGQFFTPRKLVDLAVKIVSPKLNETIIDPACGSGGFLIHAFDYITKDFDENKKREIATNCFFGIDKEIDLVKICKAYMCLMGDGRSNIARADSLKDYNDWEDKTHISKFFDNENKRRKFDIVLTNPPFGSNIKVEHSHVLKHFDLSKNKKGKEVETPPQTLFLELCINILKDNGKLAIVLPDGILGNPTSKYIRDWVTDRCKLLAIIDCHQSTFSPFTSNKCSLVVLQKKNTQEDYECFMAIIEKVGHTTRGKETKKSDWESVYEHYTKKDKKNQTHLGFYLKKKDFIKNIWNPKYYDIRTKAKIQEIKDKYSHNHIYKTIGDLENDGTIEIKTISKYPSSEEYFFHGDYRYIRTGDIFNFEINTSPRQYVIKEVYLQYKGKQDIQEQDILFVKDGDNKVGDCVILQKEDLNILLQSHFYKIRCLKINPYLFLHLLTLQLTREQIKQRTFSQGTLSSITKDRLSEVGIFIPLGDSMTEEIIHKVKTNIEKRNLYLNNLLQD